jgi:hypothetical protein
LCIQVALARALATLSNRTKILEGSCQRQLQVELEFGTATARIGEDSREKKVER